MAYFPEDLEDYHVFHSALNNFTWLLKAKWAARTDLKRKRFRLDHLFQRYLAGMVAPEPRLRRELTNTNLTPQPEAAEASLRKVWYNELAFGSPPLRDPLLLDYRGVQANLDRSHERLIFPSWKITQAYYTVYHAIRSLADLRGLPYEKVQHKAPLRAFKGSMLSPARRVLLGFPFDLGTGARRPNWSLSSLGPDLGYLKWGYANHPRFPRHSDHWGSEGQSFEKTVLEVLGTFHTRSKKSREARPYMLLDLLSDFRNWGNYVDIDNMVALKSHGFRGYLDQDLHVIVFFLAGLAELAAISILGADRVTALVSDFHARFIEREETLWRSEQAHSLDIRFRIYEHHGRLGANRWSPPSASSEAAELELLGP